MTLASRAWKTICYAHRWTMSSRRTHRLPMLFPPKSRCTGPARTVDNARAEALVRPSSRERSSLALLLARRARIVPRLLESKVFDPLAIRMLRGAFSSAMAQAFARRDLRAFALAIARTVFVHDRVILW